MNVRLRPGVKFHDGSSVGADGVAEILRSSLPAFMGPAFRDVAQITAIAEDQIEIRFTQRSRFSEEALEVPVRKPNQPTVGTGPFSPSDPTSLTELRANRNYYLGPPGVDRILVANYPSVRAAWADMLRDKIDMLYEVGTDALDSIQGANSVSLFSFTRPYQYVVLLNTQVPSLRAASARRALNLAIDRDVLIRDALGGHALPSSGPIWPRHWSLSGELPKLSFDPARASALLSGAKLHFTCLVPPDYERVALAAKRQLEAVGVVMELRAASLDEAFEALRTHAFEAVLLDLVSGPSLFRTYEVWYSSGSLNLTTMGSPQMDVALDGIRHAKSDNDYRDAVAMFQKLAVDEPPAIFLAWGERARAVNRRFDVAAEPNRDILTTLRLWRPIAGGKIASSN